MKPLGVVVHVGVETKAEVEAEQLRPASSEEGARSSSQPIAAVQR